MDVMEDMEEYIIPIERNQARDDRPGGIIMRQGNVVQFPQKITVPDSTKMIEGSHLGDDPAKVHLRGGQVLQFPQRIPDTDPRKLIEGSHLGEEKDLIHLHRGTVLQFPKESKDPDPRNLIEASHLGEEKERIHLHQGTVCQFPSKVPDFEDRLPESEHIQELDDMLKLSLKQASVCQFPKDQKESLIAHDFHPPTEPLVETLPPIEPGKYRNLLPSQARKHQAYLTHPSPQFLQQELIPDSNGPGRRGKRDWTPRFGNASMPKGNFIYPEGTGKQYVWPPPKPEHYKSYTDLGRGGVGNVWNPKSEASTKSYRPVTITRRKPVWPPPSRGMVKMSSLPDIRGKKNLDFDDCIYYRAGINVPQCYRVPPGTQFFNFEENRDI